MVNRQLRPKVNNYLLTVEKDAGYNLNRSLFERLVLKGYPHETLSQQHRMRPEISELVRHLMYPDLTDAPKTHNRPNLRGVRDNVVFIHHARPEDTLQEMRQDEEPGDVDIGRKSSKTNTYEVQMVLQILRYLGQNGYGTDKTVLLTPYLGQLRALQKALQATNDPILNDLDNADLVRAGLVSEAAANVTKSPIRLATIGDMTYLFIILNLNSCFQIIIKARRATLSLRHLHAVIRRITLVLCLHLNVSTCFSPGPEMRSFSLAMPTRSNMREEVVILGQNFLCCLRTVGTSTTVYPFDVSSIRV
jgi:hypothetical protein